MILILGDLNLEIHILYTHINLVGTLISIPTYFIHLMKQLNMLKLK